MKKKFATLAILVLIFSSSNLMAQLKSNVTDLNDGKHETTTFQSIIDQYKGKVVYLDFWASWCGPCKKEMPHSKKLQETFKGKDVVFLYISVDRNGQQWMSAVEQMALTGEHYRANPKVHQELNAKFNVRSIPRYIMIDKKGTVVSTNAIRPSNAGAVDAINKLL